MRQHLKTLAGAALLIYFSIILFGSVWETRAWGPWVFGAICAGVAFLIWRFGYLRVVFWTSRGVFALLMIGAVMVTFAILNAFAIWMGWIPVLSIFAVIVWFMGRPWTQRDAAAGVASDSSSRDS